MTDVNMAPTNYLRCGYDGSLYKSSYVGQVTREEGNK